MHVECSCRFSCNAATLNNAENLGNGKFIDIYRAVLHELGEQFVKYKLEQGVVILNPFAVIVASDYKRAVVFSFPGSVHYTSVHTTAHQAAVQE